MKNQELIRIIKDQFSLKDMDNCLINKMGKVVRREKEFLKDFDNKKRREFNDIILALMTAHNYETELLLDFAIEYIKKLKL